MCAKCDNAFSVRAARTLIQSWICCVKAFACSVEKLAYTHAGAAGAKTEPLPAQLPPSPRPALSHAGPHSRHQARLATDGERTRPGGPYPIERFIDRIVWLVQEVLTRHEGLNAERFLDDAVYKAMVQVITVRSSPCELRHNTIRHHVMSDY